MRSEALITFFLLLSGAAALLYQHELLLTPSVGEAKTQATGAGFGYALAMPVLFILALNLYLILFRSRAFLKMVKLAVLASAYFSYALIILILLSMLESLFPSLSLFFLLVLLAALLLPFAAPQKLKLWVRNVQLASFAGVAGATLASYLSLGALVLGLALLAMLDYYYVLRKRAIPKLASQLEKAGVPFGVDVGAADENRLVLGFGDLLFASSVAAASYAELGLAWGIAAIFSAATAMLVFLRFTLRSAKKAYPALPAVFFAALLVWLLAEVYGLFGGF
jgi:prepilin signal peptidase PulO-like enzyme (type II secretory pathway)